MPAFLILIYPFAEIYAFYRFIQAYSFGDAILFILLSALLGVSVIVIQGKAAFRGLQLSLTQGKMPANQILHRALILLGGLLLMVPGIISDFVGVLCILPISRHLFIGYLKRLFAKALSQGRVGFFHFQQGQARSPFSASFDPPEERDATVVDITPIEIVHQTKKNED